MIAAGRVEGAGALVGFVGVGAIPVLIEAGVSRETLRMVLNHVVMRHYHALRHVDRAAFTAWCREAEFEVPPGTPETLDLYRGTMGCSPANAARGLHWSLSFDVAAACACRFTDRHGTGVIVLHAKVPRARIAMFVVDTAHKEVIPAEPPAVFEVVTDKLRIGYAAARGVARCNDLIARGIMTDTHTEETARYSRADALITRAMMTAAGVVPETAIVA